MERDADALGYRTHEFGDSVLLERGGLQRQYLYGRVEQATRIQKFAPVTRAL